MKKAFVTIATVTIIGISSTFLTNTIHAENISDLQNKQSQVYNERSNIKSNLTNAEAEIADVMIELEELNEQIAQTEEALQSNQNMIDDTNKQISETKAKIKELEEAIAKRQNILNDRVKSYQRNGGNMGFLDVIFGSKNFGDFISRVSAVNKITSSDAELMEQQENDKKQVEKSLAELEEMQVELEGMQQVIIAQKQENEQKKQTLKQTERKLNDKISELKLKDSELASIESQVSRKLAAKRQTKIANNTIQNSSSKSADKPKKSSNNLNTLSKNTAPSSNGNINTVINAGYPHIGTPYVWAGKGPGGFDCSGFVSWAYGQGGYSIPSSTSALQYTGVKISYSNIQPGDLVFFDTYKVNGHVGIYIGNGKFIGAQNSTGLAVADMTTGYWKNKFKGHVRRVVQ